MLFQVVHTHTNTDCPAQSSEKAKQSAEWWQSFKKTSGVKVLTGYVSPLAHTFYITVETEDYLTLAKALGPLVGLGAGHVVPVLTLDETFPMVEAGAFRSNK
jgi:hypothetical protein